MRSRRAIACVALAFGVAFAGNGLAQDAPSRQRDAGQPSTARAAHVQANPTGADRATKPTGLPTPAAPKDRQQPPKTRQTALQGQDKGGDGHGHAAPGATPAPIPSGASARPRDRAPEPPSQPTKGGKPAPKPKTRPAPKPPAAESGPSRAPVQPPGAQDDERIIQDLEFFMMMEMLQDYEILDEAQ